MVLLHLPDSQSCTAENLSECAVQEEKKGGKRKMKRQKNEKEGSRVRERARERERIALMFAATTHHKVNSKGWFKNA